MKRILRRFYRRMFLIVAGYYPPGTIVKKVSRVTLPWEVVPDANVGKLGIAVGRCTRHGFLNINSAGTSVLFDGEIVRCYTWELVAID